MDPRQKFLLTTVILFVLIGLAATYNLTRSVLGGVVGQTGDDYGVGNTLSNRGFILHAIVFAIAMHFVMKKML